MNLPFATQSYRSKSAPVSAQQLVNFYAEKQLPDAKAPVVVFGSPGLEAELMVGSGPIRGMHVMNDLLYVVSGSSLYSVNNLYFPTLLGGGISGLNVVAIADNGKQVGVVNGQQTFIWDTSDNTYTPVTDPNSYPSYTITFMDGYFIKDRAGTNQFYYSGILDGTTYNALDFDSAYVDSDFVTACCNQQQNLLVFGQRTIESWYDSGNNDSPFQRFNGATVERGCTAPLSICKEDNSVFFLGNDRIFYRLNVPQPIRISQPAIEQEWQTYEIVNDCFVFSVNFEGHKFLFVTFPSAMKTWCYDISTDLWHERVSYVADANSLGRWRGNCSVVFNDVTLIGDAFGNQVGKLSSDVYLEYGAQIIGRAVLPPIHQDRRRILHNILELDVESGVGLAAGQGSDPQIVMDYSDDGARTFKSPQRFRSIGKIGEYQQRVRWTGLGNSRNRTYRFQISDPVRRTLIAARGDLDVCDA